MSTAPISPESKGPVAASPNEKEHLRRQFRARRLALPEISARAAARHAVHRLWGLPALQTARSLALYLPTGGELDCTPLAVQAWRRGRSVFLPVVTGANLRFAPFGPDSNLRNNCFGILEPAAHARHWRTARQLDVIVAPLLAFDAQGRRLGMGGGYYDRTLAYRLGRACSGRPYFIGLAYEVQRTTVLPDAAWDVRLDAVVTEIATYRFD